MTTKIVIPSRRQERRGTAARWAQLNEVLRSGEWGFETDTGLVKIGDGVTAWNSLGYIGVIHNGATPDDGDVLTFNTALGLYRPQAPSGGGTVDPGTTATFYDDFMGGVPVAGTTTNWSIDRLDGTLTQFDAGAAHPGVFRFNTGSGATGATAISRGNGVNNITFGGGEITDEWLIRAPVLSTSLQRYISHSGYRSTWFGASTSGLTCSYSDNVNSGKFVLRATIAGVATDFNGTTTVVANTWYRAKIVINAAGTAASLYINGALEATATSIPTAAMRAGILINSLVGTTPKNLDADFYKFSQTLTTLR